MKILVAPLNWGLGHASRCVPLIQKYVSDGHEVVVGGDGDALTLLRTTFPTLRWVEMAQLDLRYGKGKRQVWAMLKALPKLLWFSFRDHQMLKILGLIESFDLVISDNRFGLFPSKHRQHALTKYVYITHQLHIPLPNGWHWTEGMASWLHGQICKRYDEVWVPDYENMQRSLSGKLGHGVPFPVRYIGPLSRMVRQDKTDTRFDVVAVLSGPEPQRTILEQDIVKKYDETKEKVLIVRGKIREAATPMVHHNLTLVAHLPDDELIPILQGAKKIIARSGYSTLMDLHQLGVLDKAELIPTPGQPEQEYLATLIR